jgi:hypothetical protein
MISATEHKPDFETRIDMAKFRNSTSPNAQPREEDEIPFDSIDTDLMEDACKVIEEAAGELKLERTYISQSIRPRPVRRPVGKYNPRHSGQLKDGEYRSPYHEIPSNKNKQAPVTLNSEEAVVRNRTKRQDKILDIMGRIVNVIANIDQY